MKSLATFALLFLPVLGFGTGPCLFAQAEKPVPRLRVIVDNDFGGDPDGLFALAQHLLSPSVEIRGVIGSQNYSPGFYGQPGLAAFATGEAAALLKVMKLDQSVPLFEGAASGLSNSTTPVKSAGADFIVKEALRDDPKRPLYVVCGAGLTNLASAYLQEPKIASRLTLVWIGGPEYEGIALPPAGRHHPEYNLGIDRLAAQVIFNQSPIPIWQIPRDAYRQALVSDAELSARIDRKGPLGGFLLGRFDALMKAAHHSLGEAYALGDSPLVLVTALQSAWDPAAASSREVELKAPLINDQGDYEKNPAGREIRVYTQLDTRLMFEDLFAKIGQFDAGK
ncbi:MAG: nucleoside hydrolase [Chthoniobacteraceae bacterium]